MAVVWVADGETVRADVVIVDFGFGGLQIRQLCDDR